MSEQTDKKDKFWLVWNSNRGGPTKKHFDEGEALTEAERIALQHPHDKVYVLRVDGFYQVLQPHAEWTPVE